MPPARRLMTACVTPTAAATTVDMTVPAALASVWAVIGPDGVATVLTGTYPDVASESRRPHPREPADTRLDTDPMPPDHGGLGYGGRRRPALASRAPAS
uniref:Uncharacterized protein n=1 Tax=Streptomyces sp. NBC_00180 TaxID=2903632 RepID=A0AAU1I728_9ACTN